MKWVIPVSLDLRSVLFLRVLVYEVSYSYEFWSVKGVIPACFVCEVCYSCEFWFMKCLIPVSFSL